MYHLIMKLLVLSDSHKNTEYMEAAVRQESPDAVIHLGDHFDDAVALQKKVPDAVIYMVLGNCDVFSKGKSEILLPIENVRILLSHGHQHGVKSGLSKLAFRAVDMGADLVLYGHTHIPDIQELQGITLMNPGQIERHDEYGPASYGIVEVNDGKFNCNIVYMSSY